jgi:hypothetical protein
MNAMAASATHPAEVRNFLANLPVTLFLFHVAAETDFCLLAAVQYRVGLRVRLVTGGAIDDPLVMQHPVPFHGAGRFPPNAVTIQAKADLLIPRGGCRPVTKHGQWRVAFATVCS